MNWTEPYLVPIYQFMQVLAFVKTVAICHLQLNQTESSLEGMHNGQWEMSINVALLLQAF